MNAKEGDKIAVSYVGTLDSGKIFDQSEEGKPLEFTVGHKGIIKGFNDAVAGMAEGEEKEFSVEPQEAYGQRDEKLHAVIPKDKFPNDFNFEIGAPVFLKTPEGKSIGAIIEKVEENQVRIDLNHPLAGKKLNFKIKVEKITENDQPTS